MRWLFLSKVLPEPHASAAGVRLLELLRLAHSVGSSSPKGPTEVHYGTMAKVKPLVMRDMFEVGVHFHRAPANEDAELRKVLEKANPDVVVFDTYGAEEFYGWQVEKWCPQAMRVLDMQDMGSWRKIRQEAVLENGASIEESFACRPGLKNPTVVRELGAVLRSDIAIACGSAEYDLLVNQFKLSPNKVAHCPLLFDNREDPSARVPSYDSRAGFVLLGNYRHKPNHDAVHWTRSVIWPLIRSQIPSAKLHSYGAYTDKASKNLEDPAQGFLVKGLMAKLKTLGKYRVMLAPLRFGAGVKGKIIQAWSHGTPVVSTPIGSESMGSRHLWGPSGACDSAESIAKEAVRLHEDPTAWYAAQDAGRTILEQSFDPQLAREGFKQVIERKFTTYLKDRDSDVEMAVLCDAKSRATEYLSKYVASKTLSL